MPDTLQRAKKKKKPMSPEVHVAPSYKNPLDAPDKQDILKKLMQYRRQARVAQADNRMEMAIDEDFYDGIQLEPEDLHILMERNQPPVVYNVTKNTLNWILGTERKSRVENRVLPRKKSGASSAKSKTKLMKYTQDASKGEFEFSKAFEDAAKAGLGWIESAVRGSNTSEEPIFIRQERWRNMWFDHLGQSLDGSDWRYVFREKWVDLDYAQALFPERKDDMHVLAEGVNSLYPYLPDDVVISDTASEFDMESDIDSLFGGPFDGMRQRVKLIECWYRTAPVHVKRMVIQDEDTPFGAMQGAIYRPSNEDHKYLVNSGYFSLQDAVQMTVRCAMWAGSTFLQDALTPYNHNRFPFIPIFCYRRARDNMPYGVIRDIRDPQCDLNRRKSRSLILLTSNRVIMDKGAVDDKEEAYNEINRSDGMVEVNRDDQGKPMRFEIIKEQALAAAHVEAARDDERFINNISGVTPEQKGQSERDLSGVAIQKLAVQGETTNGVFFDNYFYARQCEGEIRLSNIEQFTDQQKEYRITGDQGTDDFVTVNEPKEDGTIENSITATKADFIIVKRDYRESLRLAGLEMLTGLIQNLAKGMPQVALALLDEVFDLMDDLPNKDELVARIRKINGQHAAEDEMTPEEKQALQQSEEAAKQEQQTVKQMQETMAQLNLALAKAKVDGVEADALKSKVEAQMKKLEGYLKALEAAAVVSLAPHITEAADSLIEESQKVPGQPEEGGQIQ